MMRAMSKRTPRVGFRRPRSISARYLMVTPARTAASSCVSPSRHRASLTRAATLRRKVSGLTTPNETVIGSFNVGLSRSCLWPPGVSMDVQLEHQREGFRPVFGGASFSPSRSMRAPGSTSTRSATLTFSALAMAKSVSSVGFLFARSTSAKYRKVRPVLKAASACVQPRRHRARWMREATRRRKVSGLTPWTRPQSASITVPTVVAYVSRRSE